MEVKYSHHIRAVSQARHRLWEPEDNCIMVLTGKEEKHCWVKMVINIHGARV